MPATVNVTVWNEFVHEREHEEVRRVYPEGIHKAIASSLEKERGFKVRTATLDQAENGLTQAILDETDVLFWWGHMAHDKVLDEVVARVKKRVLEGMGLVVLHSGHYSKIFRALMGTTCSLKWRQTGEKERLWIINRSHPIVAGLGEYIELPREEMYGECFDIPSPDELVFVSWFQGGEVFRSGCCWNRGNGRVFYFRPGHESFPTYYDPQICSILANAARWAAATVRIADICPNSPPLEPLAVSEKVREPGAK